MVDSMSKAKVVIKKMKWSYQESTREMSSFKVFRQFVTHNKDLVSGEVVCDATRILSPECYQTWLKCRRKPPKKPEEAFRRALTAHCRGVDGRRPFPMDVEESLLRELRKKQQWACFRNNKRCGSIGVLGFPSLGFHERQRLSKLSPEQMVAEKEKMLLQSRLPQEQKDNLDCWEDAYYKDTLDILSNIDVCNATGESSLTDFPEAKRIRL